MSNFDEWYNKKQSELEKIKNTKYDWTIIGDELYKINPNYKYDEKIDNKIDAIQALYEMSDYARTIGGLENTEFIDFDTDTIKLDGMDFHRPSEKSNKADALFRLSLSFDYYKTVIKELFNCEDFKIKGMPSDITLFKLIEKDIEKSGYSQFKNSNDFNGAVATIERDIEEVKLELKSQLLYKKVQKLSPESAIEYYKKVLIAPFAREKEELEKNLNQLKQSDETENSYEILSEELEKKLHEIQQKIDEVNEKNITEDIAKSELTKIMIGNGYSDKEIAIELSNSGITNFSDTSNKLKEELDKLNGIKYWSTIVENQEKNITDLNEYMLRIRKTKEYKELKESENQTNEMEKRYNEVQYKNSDILTVLQNYAGPKNIPMYNILSEVYKYANDKCEGRLKFLLDLNFSKWGADDKFEDIVQNAVSEIEKMIAEKDKPIIKIIKKKEIEELNELKSVIQETKGFGATCRELDEINTYRKEKADREKSFIEMFKNSYDHMYDANSVVANNLFWLSKSISAYPFKVEIDNVEEKVNAMMKDFESDLKNAQKTIESNYNFVGINKEDFPVKSEKFNNEIKEREEKIKKISSTTYSNINEVKITKAYKEAKEFDSENMTDEEFKEEINQVSSRRR